MNDETKNEAPMLDGVKILLDRMEMFPEEFVGQHGNGHKWSEILQFGMGGVLTDEEKKLLEVALKKATRAVFSQRVAAKILFLDKNFMDTLPTQPTPRPPAFPKNQIIGGSPVIRSGGTGGHIPLATDFAVRDKSGTTVIMREYEHKYYLKQDPKRQESYLDWIKRGRP